MTELDNLLSTSNSSSLDDLVQKEQPTDKPIINSNTATNLAAHTALLADPAGAVDTYRTIRKELGFNTESATMNGILAEANARENDLTKSAMMDILSDPEMPVDQKIKVASGWNPEQVVDREADELVAVNAIEADGQVEGNAEVDETRWDLAASIREVNNYNDEVQQMINTAEVENQPGALVSTVDFLETIVPFLEGAAAAEVQVALRQYHEKGVGNQIGGVVRSLGLLGESKEQIRQVIANVPIKDRLKLAQAVYGMVMDSEGSIVRGKNSMVLMNSLRDYLVEGHYTTSDRVIDDMASILDLFGMGATARSVLKGGKAVRSAARAAQFTRRTPKAVGTTLAETNAKKHNELLKVAAEDETGEMARTVFGSTREDAVINAVGPEIGNAEDVVRHKPLVDDKLFEPDVEAIKQITGSKGSIHFSEAEKAQYVTKVTEDFLNPDVTGVVARKEMTTVKGVDEGVNVRTVYGPAEGGFRDAATALDQVKLATRKYGVSDDEIQLLKRGRDGQYRPVEKGSKEAKAKGNYMVGINHTSRYDPADTVAWSVTDVKGNILGIPLNLFDKIPFGFKGKAGSITQHLIPSSSYIDPLLTRSAAVSVDQSAKGVDTLLSIADRYASNYKKLDNVGKTKIDNYIVEANHKSLKFNPEKLRADGFSEAELETLREWKRTNDTLYVLENTDLVRQSKRKGYQLFTSKEDSFLARPLTAQSAGKVEKVYDPATKTIRTVTSKEKKELYDAGGNIAATRVPVTVDGETIGYVLSRNTSDGYLRGLRESDKLLNYRDGHFTIYYKDPIFITQKVKNADGSEYVKAIATAGNTADAQKHLERLRATNPTGEYDFRGDLKGEALEEMQFNAKVNVGRTAQRTRGKTLADSTDRPTDMEFRHIDSPEESVIRSIQSISGRINMKEFLDTSKARFMKQYKDYLPEVDFIKQWPDDVTQLKRPKGEKADLSGYSDAVSTYRYIDQMENGFINILDDSSKNLFKTFAETTGRKGWSWLEKGGNALAEGAPTAYARKKAFRLLLAANPLRQLPVQASQALPVILATNPTFIAKLPWQGLFLRYLDRGGDVDSFIKGLGKTLTGMGVEEAKALEKAYRSSGISSAVSAHSLIRDDLKSLVARGPLAKAKAIGAKPIDIAQKYGFELGENILMKSVWLSQYDLLRKSGKVIDEAALADIHAKTRDLTLNMNKAGELAYNENALSAAMQFLQAPHKAFAQIVLGHRGLTRKERLALGTSYLVTYGTGYGFLYSQASKLIPADNRELQDIVSGGLFNLALNRTMSTIYGEEVNVDFSSSMRLLEIPNIFTMYETMATMNMNEIMKGSPSLNMVVGDNGKFGNLVRSISRAFTVPEDDGRFKDVGVTFLDMFSGASNFMKARYIIKKGYSINTKGEVIDGDVNELEAMMRVAGFQTVDEMMSYATNDVVYKKSKSVKDDIKYFGDEVAKRLAREGISEQELDYTVRMYQEANRVFGDDPYYMELIQQDINRRAKQGDHILLNRLVEMAKIATPEEMREAISLAPISEENKSELLKIINFMKEKE